jgi:predicted dehydrogenase
MGTYWAKREDLGGDWGDWKPADYEVEDFACALFRFDTGATMFVETSYLGFHDKPEEWFARVLGTRSGLHWPEGLIVREESKTPSVTQLVGKQRETPYERSIFAFARAVREDQDVPIPPEETLAVLTMMESAYRSAEAGRELPVEWES